MGWCPFLFSSTLCVRNNLNLIVGRPRGGDMVRKGTIDHRVRATARVAPTRCMGRFRKRNDAPPCVGATLAVAHPRGRPPKGGAQKGEPPMLFGHPHARKNKQPTSPFLHTIIQSLNFHRYRLRFLVCATLILLPCDSQPPY